MLEKGGEPERDTGPARRQCIAGDGQVRRCMSFHVRSSGAFPAPHPTGSTMTVRVSALVFAGVGTVLGERMPVDAMAFVDDRRASEVFPDGDGFKMGRIYTTSHATKMVERHTLRDRAAFKFVSAPMRTPAWPVGVAPIAVAVDCPHPQPTSSVGFWQNVPVINVDFRSITHCAAASTMPHSDAGAVQPLEASAVVITE